MRKVINSVDPSEVIARISTSISLLTFYNLVTRNGKNFNYNINAGGRCNWTALHVACHMQNIPLATALLKMGANPNEARDSGYTALYEAICAKNLELVQLLVHYGAYSDVFERQYRAISYLELAKKNGSDAIYEFLKSINPNKPYIQDNLPYEKRVAQYENRIDSLKDAIRNNNVDEARSLFESNRFNMHEIYFNLSSCCARIATQNGNLEMVKLLAVHGDNIVENDHIDGVTTPDLARQLGHHDIADFIESFQQSQYAILKHEAVAQLKQYNLTRNRPSSFFAMETADISEEMNNLFAETQHQSRFG